MYIQIATSNWTSTLPRLLVVNSKNGTVARTIYIISLLYCLHCPHCLHKVTARIVCGRMSVRQLLAKQRVNKLKLVKSDLNLRGTLRRDLRLMWLLSICLCHREHDNDLTTPKAPNIKKWNALAPVIPKRKPAKNAKKIYSTKITKTMGHLDDEIEKIWLAASCRIYVELLLDTSALLMKRLNKSLLKSLEAIFQLVHSKSENMPKEAPNKRCRSRSAQIKTQI